ncbi:hypothetical protein F2Q68_00005794 [Brassica cretica]|uniref:Uncharacterized protein n=1 Tax=Brassica cretica TaxID=69181 RepID=A0A8S9J423_BRACR|nr:hypothetical protein F2Q68_00005794 [Brassica cretica]
MGKESNSMNRRVSNRKSDCSAGLAFPSCPLASRAPAPPPRQPVIHTMDSVLKIFVDGCRCSFSCGEQKSQAWSHAEIMLGAFLI